MNAGLVVLGGGNGQNAIAGLIGHPVLLAAAIEYQTGGCLGDSRQSGDIADSDTFSGLHGIFICVKRESSFYHASGQRPVLQRDFCEAHQREAYLALREVARRHHGLTLIDKQLDTGVIAQQSQRLQVTAPEPLFEFTSADIRTRQDQPFAIPAQGQCIQQAQTKWPRAAQL